MDLIVTNALLTQQMQQTHQTLRRTRYLDAPDNETRGENMQADYIIEMHPPPSRCGRVDVLIIQDLGIDIICRQDLRIYATG